MEQEITYNSVLKLIYELELTNKRMLIERDKKDEERRVEESKLRAKRRVADEKRRVADEKRRVADEKRRIADEQRWAKSDKSWEALRSQMKEVQGELGGIGKSNGEIAEDFFYNGLKKNMQLMSIEIEEIDRNNNRYRKNIGLKGEYDIVLTNTDVVILVEVKSKFKAQHVIKLVEKQIPKYKILYPEKKNYKVRGAIAAFTFEDKAIELAKEYGLFILTQSGENIEVVQNATKIY